MGTSLRWFSYLQSYRKTHTGKPDSHVRLPSKLHLPHTGIRNSGVEVLPIQTAPDCEASLLHDTSSLGLDNKAGFVF